MRVLFILGLTSFTSLAFEHPAPGEAHLMGTAYSSIAEGAHSVHFNPALLGRHKGISFHPLNFNMVLPNPIEYESALSEVGETPGAIFSSLSETPLFFGYNTAPGFKFKGFAFSAVVDTDIQARFLNDVNPTLKLRYKDDRGFVIGQGLNISKNLSWGLSAKYLKRSSIDDYYSLTSTSMLNALNGEDINDILDNLGRVKSSGWSLNAGLDYVNRSSFKTFSVGLVLRDLYSTVEAEASSEGLDPITDELSVDLSSAYQIKLENFLSLILTMDYRNAMDTTTDMVDKVAIGTQFSLTQLLSLYGGYYKGGLSYGTKLNFIFADLLIGITEEDLGANSNLGKSSSMVLYLSLLDFKFEP